LWDGEGRTLAELSEATFRDAPTMSRIVDSMERQGILERRADSDDGRARRIHLTRNGRALKKKLVPLVEDIVGRMVEGIDERALVTTRSALRRMYENLAE
jgi:DNA-binding MarR family transcriptional regulator